MASQTNPNNLLQLSVSKTKTFAGCKKQYYFNYIEKLPQPPKSYLIFGTFCHEVLEAFHQEYVQGCLLPHHIVMADAFNKAYKNNKDKITSVQKQECWDILNKYLQCLSINPTLHPSNVLAVEKRFDIPLNKNVSIRGAIDKVSQDKDGVLIVSDYKSTKQKKYLKGDWFQLATYCWVLLQEQPDLEMIRGSYILLRHDFEEISKDFYRDEILAVKDKYITYAEQITNETEFAANPTILCGWCSFLEHCDAGKKQTGLYNGEEDW
jgi:ATP-dependent helicase/DNAse subunit B